MVHRVVTVAGQGAAVEASNTLAVERPDNALCSHISCQETNACQVGHDLFFPTNTHKVLGLGYRNGVFVMLLCWLSHQLTCFCSTMSAVCPCQSMDVKLTWNKEIRQCPSERGCKDWHFAAKRSSGATHQRCNSIRSARVAVQSHR